MVAGSKRERNRADRQTEAMLALPGFSPMRGKQWVKCPNISLKSLMHSNTSMLHERPRVLRRWSINHRLTDGYSSLNSFFEYVFKTPIIFSLRGWQLFETLRAWLCSSPQTEQRTGQAFGQRLATALHAHQYKPPAHHLRVLCSLSSVCFSPSPHFLPTRLISPNFNRALK